MSEPLDRRARKKARTRAEIRSVARRLFAERGFDGVTIADIATEAGVAAQTVFNHFATKEELFFDGRTPWVAGAADSVRSRPPGTPPLRALREYLVDTVSALAGAHASEERRRFVATIEASPALRARELELVNEAEQLLAATLTEAWTKDDRSGAPVPDDPATSAALTAGTWLAITRVLLVGQRPALYEGGNAAQAAERIEALADRLLRQLEQGLGPVPVGVTGWPADIRRAG